MVPGSSALSHLAGCVRAPCLSLATTASSCAVYGLCLRVNLTMHLPAVYPGLTEKTVFITGGGGGIGAARTAVVAAQGGRVAFVDIAEAESAAPVPLPPPVMKTVFS